MHKFFLSLLAVITTFHQFYHYNQLVVTSNEMAGLYCRYHAATDRPAANFVWFVPSTSRNLLSQGSLHGARIFLLS